MIEINLIEFNEIKTIKTSELNQRSRILDLHPGNSRWWSCCHCRMLYTARFISSSLVCKYLNVDSHTKTIFQLWFFFFFQYDCYYFIVSNDYYLFGFENSKNVLLRGRMTCCCWLIQVSKSKQLHFHLGTSKQQKSLCNKERKSQWERQRERRRYIYKMWRS